MDSINEQTSEEINETSEKKISNKKEKGSGKGKLPENQENYNSKWEVENQGRFRKLRSHGCPPAF